MDPSPARRCSPPTLAAKTSGSRVEVDVAGDAFTAFQRLDGFEQPFLEQAGLEGEVRSVSLEWLAQLVVLVKERAKTLVEMVHWVTPYFGESVLFDEEAAKKFLTPAHVPLLTKLADRFEAFPTVSKEEWEESFKKLVEKEGIKMGQLAQPVRVALTGRTASPGLFEVMEVLGRDRTLKRLRRGIEQASRS